MDSYVTPNSASQFQTFGLSTRIVQQAKNTYKKIQDPSKV